MNIDYKSRGTRGTYTNQGARDKNLSLGFSPTGTKYSINAGYISNMASLKVFCGTGTLPIPCSTCRR